MSARQNILARLRSAPALPVERPDVAGRYRPFNAPGDSHADRVQALTQALTATRTEVIKATAASWREKLVEVCAAKAIRTLMLPAGGLELAAWDGGPELRRFDRPIETHKDALFREVDAGLTLADCAIADTGLLALASGPDQPRTLSLVPPINIVLLDASRLYPDLPSAMRAEGWAAGLPTNQIFISGPSKTADIQQTLAYGAHGPKELVVLLVSGEDA